MKQTRFCVLLIFLLALGMRVGHVLSMRSCPLFYHPVMDMAEHDRWARRLAEGDWLGRGAFFRAPLYCYCLGLVYLVSGCSPLAARLVQCLVGALSCLLIYLLAARAFDGKSACLAMFISAVYWPFIFFEGELLLTGTAMFLNLLSILAVDRAFRRKSPASCLLAGLTLGLAAVTRPNIALFAAFALLLSTRAVLSGRMPWPAPAALLFGAILVVAPVTLRNYVVSGDPVLICWQGGVNFYIGNNRRADGHTAVVPGTRPSWEGGFNDSVSIAVKESGKKLGPSGISGFWFRKAFCFIVDDPGAFVRLFIKKILLLLAAPEIPNNISPYFFRRFSSVLSLPLPGYWLIAPLGLCGMILLAEKQGLRGLLVSYYLVYGLSIVLFFVCGRFRVQIVPVLIIFAAAFSLELMHAARRKGPWKRFLARTALLFVVFCAVNLPWLWYGGHLPAHDAWSYVTLGNACLKSGELSKACDAYERALDIAVKDGTGKDGDLAGRLHRQLSGLYGKLGKKEPAIRHRRALDDSGALPQCDTGARVGSRESRP